MQINLYPHQQKIIDNNKPRLLLAHSTGTGKTITSISLANKNCKDCLVIVPKALKDQWEEEIKKYSTTCSFYVMTKENFKKEVKSLQVYDGVIFDEGHFAASMTSQLSKSLYWYLSKNNIQYRWIATATPYLSTPWNIFTLARHLGYDWNYQTFKYKFFYEVRMGHRTVPMQKPNMEGEIANLVREIGSVVDMKEEVDVPEQKFITEYFELTKEQEEAIKKLDDSNFISRWTHSHCIENGILYSDGYTEDQEFESNKTDRIIELVKKNDKIAIFCRYNAQLEYYKKILSSHHKKIYIINGNTKDKNAIIKSIEFKDRCIVLIQADCAYGYELPSIDTIIFASLSFSHVAHIQAQGRFLRINRLKPNTYYYLVCNGVDKDVYNCIMDKQDFHIEIYSTSKQID